MVRSIAISEYIAVIGIRVFQSQLPTFYYHQESFVSYVATKTSMIEDFDLKQALILDLDMLVHINLSRLI